MLSANKKAARAELQAMFPEDTITAAEVMRLVVERRSNMNENTIKAHMLSRHEKSLINRAITANTKKSKKKVKKTANNGATKKVKKTKAPAEKKPKAPAAPKKPRKSKKAAAAETESKTTE